VSEQAQESRHRIWPESLAYGLVVWLPVAVISLWLGLPTRLMSGLGSTGLLAEILGFYVISYPAFIIPTLVRAWKRGVIIGDGVKILAWIHYAVVVSILSGFGLFNLLVAMGVPPAEAFSFGPPLAGILAIGVIILLSKLEKRLVSRTGQSSNTSTSDTALAIPIDLWSSRGGACAFFVAFCGTVLLYCAVSYFVLLGFGLDFPPSTFLVATILASITGVLAFCYSATGWIQSTYLSALLWVSVIPALLVAGYLSAVCLVPLYFGSLWGNRVADRERIPRLAAFLRERLEPGKTLDLKHLSWLKEKRDFIRYAWKFKLLKAAAEIIDYHISSSSTLESIT